MRNDYLKSVWSQLRASRRALPMRAAGLTKNRKHYLKYQKHRSPYRAELNRVARQMGHYGNTPPNRDLVHRNGRVAGLGNRHLNREDGARKASRQRRWG